MTKTGRPNNDPIEPNDGLLVQVMKLMDDFLFKDNKLFDPKRTGSAPLQKAKFISAKADEHGISLNAVQLKLKLFEPFAKRKRITLSKDYITRLSDLLILLAPDYDDYDRQLYFVEDFKKKFGNEVEADANSEAAVTNLLNKNSAIIQLLMSDRWYIYERFGETHHRDSEDKFGIAVGEMYFILNGNELKVKVSFVLNDIDREYNGEVSFDTNFDYVYIVMSLKDFGKKAMLTLRLAEDDILHQTLMLGHFTYHSKVYRHLMTKAVVVHKISDSNQLSKRDYPYKSDEYKNDIDPAISRFLYSRDKNRLSFPRDVVASKSELDGWLKKQEDKLPQVLHHFKHEYYVYYRKEQNVIVEDELEIKLNPESIAFEGWYTHSPDTNKKNEKHWKGVAFINNRVMVFQLREYAGNRKPEEDPILLTFHTPDEKISFDDCQCLPGLISGLQDSSRVPVSFICLIVKKDTPKFKRLQDKRLESYFENAGTCQMTTYAPGFRLDDWETK